ncbi:MAG: hypothetical protein ACKVPX_02870 [Myxococcaceae bacterium]
MTDFEKERGHFGALCAFQRLGNTLGHAPNEISATELDVLNDIFFGDLTPLWEMANAAWRNLLERTIGPFLQNIGSRVIGSLPSTTVLNAANAQVLACLKAWEEPEKRVEELGRLASALRGLSEAVPAYQGQLNLLARACEVPAWLPPVRDAVGGVQ